MLLEMDAMTCTYAAYWYMPLLHDDCRLMMCTCRVPQMMLLVVILNVSAFAYAHEPRVGFCTGAR